MNGKPTVVPTEATSFRISFDIEIHSTVLRSDTQSRTIITAPNTGGAFSHLSVPHTSVDMDHRRSLVTQKPLLFPQAERPVSVAELVERANLDEWMHAQASNLTLTSSIGATSDLIDACCRLDMEDMVEIYNGQVDDRLLEERFVQLIRVAGLILDVSPRHPQYKRILGTDGFETGSKRVVEYLLEIKSYLVLRFNTWMNSHSGSTAAGSAPGANAIASKYHSTSVEQRHCRSCCAQGGLSPVDDHIEQSTIKSEVLTRRMQDLGLRRLLQVSDSDDTQGAHDRNFDQHRDKVTAEIFTGRKIETLLDILFDDTIICEPIVSADQENKISRKKHESHRKETSTRQLLHQLAVIAAPASHKQKADSTYESGDASDATIYSEAASYTESTDYGLYYRRMALSSDESDAFL